MAGFISGMNFQAKVARRQRTNYYYRMLEMLDFSARFIVNLCGNIYSVACTGTFAHTVVFISLDLAWLDFRVDGERKQWSDVHHESIWSLLSHAQKHTHTCTEPFIDRSHALYFMDLLVYFDSALVHAFSHNNNNNNMAVKLCSKAFEAMCRNRHTTKRERKIAANAKINTAMATEQLKLK